MRWADSLVIKKCCFSKRIHYRDTASDCSLLQPTSLQHLSGRSPVSIEPCYLCAEDEVYHDAKQTSLQQRQKQGGHLMIFRLPVRALTSGSASCRALCLQEQVAPSRADFDSNTHGLNAQSEWYTVRGENRLAFWVSEELNRRMQQTAQWS
jgi:hypothetical protein